MCEIMQEIKNSGIAEGIAEGKQQLILQQYHDNILTITQAAAYLHMSTDDFLALEKEHNAYAF